MVPAAAAFEQPDKVELRAGEYFESLGVKCRTVPVLHRAEADDARIAETVRRAKFVYLCDGSPLHLRSVLKDSALFDAILAAYHGGAALAASGAGATLVGDPMVDPRGGAYTVGLGLVPNLAVFPYHGTAADHMRERSIDLLAEVGEARRDRRGDRAGARPRTARGASRAPEWSRSTRVARRASSRRARRSTRSADASAAGSGLARP